MARRSAAAVPAGGRRRPRLERGDLRLGAGADLRGAAAGARADRRRRGELLGGHAVAALRLLPGRRGAGGALAHLLRGDPGRLGARVTSWAARSNAHFGWRRGVLRGRRAGRGAGARRCSSCAIRRAARSTRAAGPRAPTVAARCAAAPSRARPELPLQHRRPRPSTPSRWAGWRSGCRPTSCACATCRSRSRRPDVRRRAGCWRASSARWSAGGSATGWRAARPTGTSFCRAWRWSRRCRSRCSAIAAPLACYLLAGDVRDARSCCSSTPGRSTRRWPTSCRPSCAAGASPSTRWRSTSSATPARRRSSASPPIAIGLRAAGARRR